MRLFVSGEGGSFAQRRVVPDSGLGVRSDRPQGGTVLAQIHCFAVRLSSTLDNARQRGYKAPE
jgi:hypothetical protein